MRLHLSFLLLGCGAPDLAAPEASDLVSPTLYMARYRQTYEIQFPLKAAPSTTW